MDFLLNYYSTADVSGTIRYKRRKGFDQAPASLLHVAIRCRGQVSIDRHLTLKIWLKLLRISPDLELTDKNGNTAMLYAEFYFPEPYVANVLLDSGADALVANKYGENSLHLLSRRLSACSMRYVSTEARATNA